MSIINRSSCCHYRLKRKGLALGVDFKAVDQHAQAVQRGVFLPLLLKQLAAEDRADLPVAKAKGVVLGGKGTGQERANGARREQASAAAERYRGTWLRWRPLVPACERWERRWRRLV
jgi:hypothetical protein